MNSPETNQIMYGEKSTKVESLLAKFGLLPKQRVHE
jgi:hypothetical protein